MIDFNKIVQEREVVVPVYNNSFKYNRKEYKLKCEDGWKRVKIKSNNASLIEDVFIEAETNAPLNSIKGYSHNNLIIFFNKDVAYRKFGFNMSKELRFNNSQSFTAINAVVWEDKEIYFYGPDYNDFKILELKDAYDNEYGIGNLKGLTPEMKNVYLLHNVEREHLRIAQKISEEKAAREEMLKTIPGRLQFHFEGAGAKLLDYSISGKRINVIWELNGTKFDSILNSGTFMVEEAGYCMTHDDKRHNITSLVKTAEDYDEDGLIYITRGR